MESVLLKKHIPKSDFFFQKANLRFIILIYNYEPQTIVKNFSCDLCFDTL